MKISEILNIYEWLKDYGMPEKFLQQLDQDGLYVVWKLALHGELPTMDYLAYQQKTMFVGKEKSGED